ncbi:MAG: hypothetical protein QOC85_2256, partial [Streptomyces sp.]|nr:hypothetical protein [Streptomyces sp.]
MLSKCVSRWQVRRTEPTTALGPASTPLLVP